MDPIRIVFLDFDGVINKGAGPWWPECVAELNRITDATGAKIVVHSTWRYGRTLDEIRSILTDGHLHMAQAAQVTGEIIDLAPVPDGAKADHAQGIIVLDDEDFARFAKGLPTKWAYERPAAIQRWLDDHPEVGVNDIVILDDVTSEPGMAHLNHRWVKTQINIGLTRAHSDRAIALLRGSPSRPVG